MTDANTKLTDSHSAPAVAAVAPQASRLMVLMFTDLVGSVKLKADLGLSAYAKLLARHDTLFRSIVESTPGAEVRQDTGDGFYAAFATPSDAVSAGLRFQLGLRTGEWYPKPLGVRVGIHLGQMEQVSPADAAGYTKLVGLGADLAARVMSLALPGQVLMTRGVFDDARLYVRTIPATAAAGGPASGGSPDAPPQWLAHGRYRLAGQDEPVDVYEAGVASVSPLVPPPDSEKAKRFLGPDEELTLGWRPAAGRDIPGRPGWHVDRKLGEGGFGEVWLGRNARTKTERVYKFCFDADRLRSLKRELTLFRLLREALGDRPDIAKLHDVRLDKPPFFLESDFSPLGDLGDWAAAKGGIDQVPLATRLDLVARTADAVAAAHSVGVLHKDLKPSNILIYEADDGTPRPRLADFGIGILTDRSRLEGLQITAAGFSQTLLTENDSSRTGTRMYAPPEMLAGKPYTTRGDVYALGVLLYQMAVGRLDHPLAVGWERGRGRRRDPGGRRRVRRGGPGQAGRIGLPVGRAAEIRQCSTEGPPSGGPCRRPPAGVSVERSTCSINSGCRNDVLYRPRTGPRCSQACDRPSQGAPARARGPDGSGHRRVLPRDPERHGPRAAG